MKNMRSIFALLCGAFSASAYAADLSPNIRNLQGILSFCVVDSNTQISISDHGWLPSTAADDLFNTLKTKVTAYRIPMVSDISKCAYPTYYISIEVNITNPASYGFRAANVNLFVNAWGLSNGISNANIYNQGYIYVTPKDPRDFEQDLIQTVGSLMDTMAADWALAHP